MLLPRATDYTVPPFLCFPITVNGFVRMGDLNLISEHSRNAWRATSVRQMIPCGMR